MLHHLVYRRNKSYYKRWMHDCDAALGAFCSGGTVSNITALWAARNTHFPLPKGLRCGARRDTQSAAFYGFNDVAILISRLWTLFIRKTADVLGIGRESVFTVDTDRNNRIDLRKLAENLQTIEIPKGEDTQSGRHRGNHGDRKRRPLARHGGGLPKSLRSFHVDAAWGGSNSVFNRKHLLNGIERADSVTTTQISSSMSRWSGMGATGIPLHCRASHHHAEYVLRKGSKDLERTRWRVHVRKNHAGSLCIEYHRTQGYELLIDQVLKKRKFATS